MDMCRKIWAVARINFQRWKGDRRVWLVFLFVGAVVFKEISCLTRYGLDYGEKCTVFLLPFMFESATISIGVIKTLLFLGGLFLLCDAPFIYRITPYEVVRSRRQCWWLGECLYILLVSFVYILFIMLVSSAAVLPVASFGRDWGGAVEAFVHGTEMMDGGAVRMMYGMNLGISQNVLAYLYPSGSQVYTFLTVWAVSFILGLLQYLVSLKTKSTFLGIAAAGIVVFLDPVLVWLFDRRSLMLLSSPVCWVSLGSLKDVNVKNALTIPHVIVGILLWIVVLLFFIWRVSRKVTIEVRGEV